MGFIFRMLEPIERKPLAVVLADKLEEEIRTGQLKGYVAGRRILAKRYGVNEKTASAALNVLSKKGLLADAESGKRRKIIAQDVKPAAKAASKRLLILHQANTPLPVEDVLLLRDVQDSWEANGGPVSWARVDFGRYKKPGRVLDGGDRSLWGGCSRADVPDGTLVYRGCEKVAHFSIWWRVLCKP